MSANEPATSTVAPGTVSTLLRKLARAPPRDIGALPQLRPGQRVGRFELGREIGRGGFGVVFEAHDRESDRTFALKALRIGGKIDVREKRLLQEAEAAARLSHPNVVALHDVMHVEGRPYLVLELLRGCTLGARLAAGAVPVREALRVAVEVARAIAYAHAQGVIHRDLTPGNVYLCGDGGVKVLDFGMAHAFGLRKPEGGTTAYMAPEQRRGAPEDERTDVFALGVILHQMLCREHPFGEGGHARRRRPARLDVAGHPDLGVFVGRMLEKDPVDRPRDGDEVLRALGAFRDALERAPTPEPPVRVRSPRGATWRSGVVLATGALLAVVLVLSRHLQRGGEGVTANAPPPAAGAVRVPGATAAPAPANASEAGRAAPMAATSGGEPSPAPAQRTRSGATRSAEAARPRTRIVYCRDRVNAIATPSRATGDGVLAMQAEPFGEVYLDGRALGETPSECRVSAGTHVVKMIHPQYGARSARVQVEAGGRARWTADFVE